MSSEWWVVGVVKSSKTAKLHLNLANQGLNGNNGHARVVIRLVGVGGRCGDNGWHRL